MRYIIRYQAQEPRFQAKVLGEMRGCCGLSCRNGGQMGIAECLFVFGVFFPTLPQAAIALEVWLWAPS